VLAKFWLVAIFFGLSFCLNEVWLKVISLMSGFRKSV